MARSQRSWDTDALPTGAAKARAVRDMFDAIAPRYDLVNRVMTFRLDVRWRKATVEALHLPPKSLVLDLASGTGDFCRELERQGLRPLSFDFSYGMLAADTSEAPRTQADALRLPVRDSSVHGVTCGFALRNFTDLPSFFGELARVTQSGGRVALLDVSVPTNPLVRLGNTIYFGHIVPKLGALLSDGPAYRYLPRSVSYLPSAVDLARMLTDSGFLDVRHRQLSGGLTQLLTGTRG
ncbi:MAG: ubiquinone/menaquinone biosynthesis methyltransferase [Actinobacteria bacterium]|nr:ubiquinone/menaquinone biosynthesis methyltransferase [Actinomycetota bacterium]MBM3815828.1 ubiquinone/menaquinone biosynthesis methyltransferase [Actinomycetota bacterium]